MKRLNALSTRLLLVFAVSLFAVSVCAAQQQNANDKAAAPDKDKAAATTATATTNASKVEEELAKTPGGKTIAKFFAAFNSGDIKQMRAFHEAYGGDTENADKDLEFYERTGGLKLQRVTRSTSDAVSVLVQTKKDARWLTFNFTLGTEPPHAINNISVRPATEPEN